MYGNVTVTFFKEHSPERSLLKLYGALKIQPASLSVQMIGRRNKSPSLLSGHSQNRSQRHGSHPSLQIVTAVKRYFSGGLQRPAFRKSRKRTNVHTVVGHIRIKVHDIEHGVPPLQVHRVGCHIHIQFSIFLIIGTAAGQRSIQQEFFSIDLFAVKRDLADICSSCQLSGCQLIYALPADPAAPVRGAEIIDRSLISSHYRFRFNIREGFTLIRNLL